MQVDNSRNLISIVIVRDTDLVTVFRDYESELNSKHLRNQTVNVFIDLTNYADANRNYIEVCTQLIVGLFRIRLIAEEVVKTTVLLLPNDNSWSTLSVYGLWCTAVNTVPSKINNKLVYTRAEAEQYLQYS